jgi:hypothetical protein
VAALRVVQERGELARRVFQSRRCPCGASGTASNGGQNQVLATSLQAGAGQIIYGRSSVVEQRPFKSLLTRTNTGVFRGFKNLAAHACPRFPTIPYGSIQERCKSLAGIVPKVSRDFVVPLGIANGAPAKCALMLAASEFLR